MSITCNHVGSGCSYPFLAVQRSHLNSLALAFPCRLCAAPAPSSARMLSAGAPCELCWRLHSLQHLILSAPSSHCLSESSHSRNRPLGAEFRAGGGVFMYVVKVHCHCHSVLGPVPTLTVRQSNVDIAYSDFTEEKWRLGLIRWLRG